ncbi:hypothetical protein KAX02_13840 [candidate division WOR-3 bacterium]|nr:hypothetical protein [candidate division WOR-3 bacterium]
MIRSRPQITVAEVIRFLSKLPNDLLVFCSVSEVNIDEPEETQEFILDDEKRACVAMETDKKSLTFGYIDLT